MSNPTEPKFPKRGFNAHFDRDIVAPDGWYLLPAGTDLVDRDRSWTLGGWGLMELWPSGVVVMDKHAWTYARKLPDGQLNDDLPGRGALEANLCVGLQLYTRDGRKAGNAIITGHTRNRDGDDTWDLETDFGNEILTLHTAEVLGMWWTDAGNGCAPRIGIDRWRSDRARLLQACAALSAVDPLAEEQRRVAQLRDALHAVYENCRQNRNKGIGAGPLAKARTALIAAGVDLKAPLQWEGTPEAESQFAPTDPRTLARAKLQAWGDIARAALERNTADSDCMRRLALTHFTSLLERIIPTLIEHRPDLRPVDVVRQAAEMARVAMEKAAAFAAEPVVPPANEPTTAVDDERLDPAAALKLYRSTVRENGHTHPDAPVLRMTHDGKVTTFGAIEAPAGCYLLPAGTELQDGDMAIIGDGTWIAVQRAGRVTKGGECDKVLPSHQFCYARKLPPAERFDGSFS